MLGGLILQDPAATAHFPVAVELFRRAAAQGNLDAEYNLGVCLRRGLGVAADVEGAERSYRSAAQRNYVPAQVALADLIAERATSNAAWAEAAECFRLAAESGNPVAMTRLAQLHERGQGVRLDRQTALVLYQRAAAAGNDEAGRAARRMAANSDGKPP